ncbi:MAG TPA: gliding motility-associated C-terminal domain-containing protein [Chitinophagaceae bacterium]|nr:gliding motility-associated C-terminal domain-containing protein [Chitinophagaceae bacterium]
MFSVLISAFKLTAQCPPNLSFEMGDFGNWQLSTGRVDQNGIVQIFTQGEVANRHTILRIDQPGSDPYGHFPVTSPDGSKYSIKLGNDNVGAEAERISYTFTIPAGQNDYSIVYNYAVVFQDPGHLVFQQPRFAAKVFDIAANSYLPCSSYDFIASGSLPGFLLSDVFVNASQNVYYKPWSLATIKLSGCAGKTVRLEFTTNDCTADEHFGYAYIDIIDNCSTLISGNVWCNGNRSIKLTAPYGYQNYNWYDQSLSTLLGSSTTLTVAPPPPEGTVYGLIITPYPGSGCLDTLYTTINYINTPFNFTVADSARFCRPSIGDLTSSWITTGSTPGLSYSYFTDATGLNNLYKPDSINTNGTYYIKASDAGGCNDIKPIEVIINNPPAITVHDPPTVHYPSKTDITSLALITGNIAGLSFSYWKDEAATSGVSDPSAIDSAGLYFIKATNIAGCSVVKPVDVVVSIARPPNIFSPNGDGINDRWEIPGLKQYSQGVVDIFNRYGQAIFHSNGYYIPWDGKIKSKNVPPGTYYYIIRISNKLTPLTGFVDVIY